MLVRIRWGLLQCGWSSFLVMQRGEAQSCEWPPTASDSALQGSGWRRQTSLYLLLSWRFFCPGWPLDKLSRAREGDFRRAWSARLRSRAKEEIGRWSVGSRLPRGEFWAHPGGTMSLTTGSRDVWRSDIKSRVSQSSASWKCAEDTRSSTKNGVHPWAIKQSRGSCLPVNKARLPGLAQIIPVFSYSGISP